MYNDWKLDDGRIIRLITPEQLKNLPIGTPLTCIDGSVQVKGNDYIDDDTRGGYLAFGQLVKSEPDGCTCWYEHQPNVDCSGIKDAKP